MSFNGKRLVILRTAEGWSQGDLAKRAKVTPTTVHEWESNKKIPGRDKLDVLADIFGTTVDYLMGRTDEKDRMDEIKKGIESNKPDLMHIIMRTKPHIDGVPIDEETAKLLYYQLKAVKEKLLEDRQKKNQIKQAACGS